MHTIRFYNYLTEAETLAEFCTANGQEVSPADIQGIGMVAWAEERPVGFLFAIAGHAPTVLLDKLVLDQSYPEMEEVAIDLGVSLLGLLQQCGAKEVLAGIKHPKVLEVLQILGFQKQEVTLVRGELEVIAKRLSAYFEAVPSKRAALNEAAAEGKK